MFISKKNVQFFIALGIGFFLVILSIGKLDIGKLFAVIHQGHFMIAVPIFGISIFGYWIRSLRWKLILESMQESPPTNHLFAALSMGYAVNFATPRLGEIARCIVLQKTTHIPIEKSLLSVVVERVFDIICLLVIVLLVASLNYSQSSLFFYQQIYSPIIYVFSKIHWFWVVAIVLMCMVLGYIGIQKISKHTRVILFLNQSLQSLKSILYLQQKIHFVVYTLVIWCCYYLMTYLWFFTFDETNGLGFKEALIIMAVGSIGRSVPIQGGGMGAYHFLVSNAFALFGVTLLVGNAMAIVIHGAQMILTFALGFFSWIWMLTYIKKK